ncbi:hypothetical protein D3C77_557390 [compost metagenome]
MMIARQAFEHQTQGLLVNQQLMLQPSLFQRGGINALRCAQPCSVEAHFLPTVNSQALAIAFDMRGRIDHRHTGGITKLLDDKPSAHDTDTAMLGQHQEWPRGILDHIHPYFPLHQAHGTALSIEL